MRLEALGHAAAVCQEAERVPRPRPIGRVQLGQGAAQMQEDFASQCL